LGRGGLKAVHELTGVSQTPIISGKEELREGTVEYNRIRKPGGGRKTNVRKYIAIQEEIENITGNTTVGNPAKVIWRTTKSLRNIEKALREKGFDVSRDRIGNN
jgi:hypothetical protein